MTLPSDSACFQVVCTGLVAMVLALSGAVSDTNLSSFRSLRLLLLARIIKRAKGVRLMVPRRPSLSYSVNQRNSRPQDLFSCSSLIFCLIFCLSLSRSLSLYVSGFDGAVDSRFTHSHTQRSLCICLSLVTNCLSHIVSESVDFSL